MKEASLVRPSEAHCASCPARLSKTHLPGAGPAATSAAPQGPACGHGRCAPLNIRYVSHVHADTGAVARATRAGGLTPSHARTV